MPELVLYGTRLLAQASLGKLPTNESGPDCLEHQVEHGELRAGPGLRVGLPPGPVQLAGSPRCDRHVSGLRDRASVGVRGRPEYGLRCRVDRRRVGRRWRVDWPVDDNLLLTDGLDLLLTLLLDGPLLHGLVEVRTPAVVYSQITPLPLPFPSVPYFSTYRGLHFFSGISVLDGRHF